MRRPFFCTNSVVFEPAGEESPKTSFSSSSHDKLTPARKIVQEREKRWQLHFHLALLSKLPNIAKNYFAKEQVYTNTSCVIIYTVIEYEQYIRTRTRGEVSKLRTIDSYHE